MRFYHGTDLVSATALLGGEPLDVARAAALKIDGPPGFFLAAEASDAEFFAVRRPRKPGVLLAYEVSDAALVRLRSAGAVLRPIPIGPDSPRFAGQELHVPVGAFDVFNILMRGGEIRVEAVC
jgi:hypothetical protein